MEIVCSSQLEQGLGEGISSLHSCRISALQWGRCRRNGQCKCLSSLLSHLPSPGFETRTGVIVAVNVIRLLLK